MEIRKEVLKKAKKAVCGKRVQDYGKPEDNFTDIAIYWGDYLDKEITPRDVAMMMILLKVARIENGGGSGDSFADIAGYAACAAEVSGKAAKR